MHATEYMLEKPENALCTILEVVNFNVAFYVNCLNSLLLTMHKRNSQFQDNDKYDIKSFEHMTVLTRVVKTARFF